MTEVILVAMLGLIAFGVSVGFFGLFMWLIMSLFARPRRGLTNCPNCRLLCDWTDNFCVACGTELPQPKPHSLKPFERRLFEERFNRMKKTGGKCWRDHAEMAAALPEPSEEIKKLGGVVGGRFCQECGEEINKLVF